MKKIGKFVNLLLLISLVMSLHTPVFASNMNLPSNEAEQVFIHNGHGEYVMAPSLSKAAKSNEIVYAEGASDDDLFQLANGKFLSRAYDNIFLLSDKIDVDVENFENNTAIFDKYNVSDKLRAEMQSEIITQREIGNEDFTIEVYAPSINEIQPLANEPLGERYYTYFLDGVTYKMKDYSVKYSNLSSGMQEKKDKSALPAAKSFVNLVITCAGITSNTIAVFGTVSGIAQSAYDMYKSVFGEVITPRIGDQIYTNLIWDKLIKDTYCADPVYGGFPNAGCTTYKVWLNRHDTYEYYSETGIGKLFQISINKELYSPLFKDPCPMAIVNDIQASYIDTGISTTLYGKRISLA